MVGVPYRRITHLRKHLALEFLDAGHILGSASVDLRITEGGNHRLVFSGDIGRSGLPIIRDPEPPSGPDRHPDRRVHLRRPATTSRVAGRRGAPGRGGPADRRAGRQGADSRLRAGPGAGAGLRLHQLCRAGRSPRSRSTWTARWRWTPPPSSGCTPRCSTSASSSSRTRAGCSTSPWSATCATWRNRRRSTPAARPGGHHRGARAWRSRAASCTTWPTASATTATWSCFVGFQAEHTLGRRIQERRRRWSASWARSTRVAPRSRPSTATRPTPTGTSSAPGCAGWAGRSGGRSWCTASRPRCEAMAAMLREEGVRDVHVPRHGESVRPVTRGAAPSLRLLRHVRWALWLLAGGHRLHGGAGDGADGEPAGPAAAGGRHRRAGRRPVQRPPLAGAARPAGPRAGAVPRRPRAARSW